MIVREHFRKKVFSAIREKFRQNIDKLFCDMEQCIEKKKSEISSYHWKQIRNKYSEKTSITAKSKIKQKCADTIKTIQDQEINKIKDQYFVMIDAEIEKFYDQHQYSDFTVYGYRPTKQDLDYYYACLDVFQKKKALEFAEYKSKKKSCCAIL